MPRLTGWRWWAGRVEDVDDDGVFALAEGGSRDEVIERALAGCSPGDSFYIIEARHWQRAEPPADGVDPFARFKNRERLTVSGDGAAVPA